MSYNELFINYLSQVFDYGDGKLTSALVYIIYIYIINIYNIHLHICHICYLYIYYLYTYT